MPHQGEWHTQALSVEIAAMGHSDLSAVRRFLLVTLGSALGLGTASCGAVDVFGGTGTATLSWTAVRQATDGKPLEGLAGYKVYYGTSATAMNTMVVVSNPGVTTYVVDHLASGTWYFAVVAYTRNGMQSHLSNIAQKTIQ
jgi:hypothetical protein